MSESEWFAERGLKSPLCLLRNLSLSDGLLKGGGQARKNCDFKYFPMKEYERSGKWEVQTQTSGGYRIKKPVRSLRDFMTKRIFLHY
jgi:hypothetical protein